MSEKILFEVSTPLRVMVRTTAEYWNYLVHVKHRNMAGKEHLVKEILKRPIEIRRSRFDKGVFLYYGHENDKLYCVVARHAGHSGFMITAYRTSKIEEGDMIWKK